jgi:hypothetical protein
MALDTEHQLLWFGEEWHKDEWFGSALNKKDNIMAKETKNTPVKPTPATPAPEANAGIDISKLTPEQLQALQKQMKAKGKELRGKKDERFSIIDTMLKEKDSSGEFKHTTRDIMNALDAKGLVNRTVDKWDQVEIKKIQARKQFLEKATDEKGKLVHPEGTFGYKASAALGFVSATSVEKFFTDPAKVKTLTDAQRKVILAALE